ncbi:MAG: hypothetical protein E7E64_04420 [Clostridium celatum]|nr:hypothetical protein [Clostridium celatum]MDU2121757.1 hypothetical protein [Clostridium celatum]MDU4979284.1 hypothetical protein [Clostridium celatum]
MDSSIKKYKIYNIVVISLIAICFLLFNVFIKISLDSKKISPSDILDRDINADFFIVNKDIYIYAEEIKWINDLDFNERKLIGTINKSNVEEDFKEWNSTKLKVGTGIYEIGGNIKEEYGDRILLAKIGEEYIPYFRYSNNVKLD